MLRICATVPKVQLDLCESIPMPEQIKAPGMQILLNLCEGEIIQDAEVQKAALDVLVLCVCGSKTRVKKTDRKYLLVDDLNVLFFFSVSRTSSSHQWKQKGDSSNERRGIHKHNLGMCSKK